MVGRHIHVVFSHNGATENHHYTADHSSVSSLRAPDSETVGLKVELENGRDKHGPVVYAIYEHFSYVIVRPTTKDED